jgi:carbonic anhydrase
MPKRFEEEWNALIAGYKKFRERYFAHDHHIFEKLAKQGQHPKTMVISCSDSRVDPSIILSCAPGDIFVVRNVANLVPPFNDKPRNNSIGAALEFAVRYLEVQNIVVLGHSYCGGIKALLESKNTQAQNEISSEEIFIQDWVKIAEPVRDQVLETCKDQPHSTQAKACEEQVLLLSLKNLETYPWIHHKVKSGNLSLHAWRFDINDGIIQYYNQASKKFEDLSPENLKQVNQTEKPEPALDLLRAKL